MLCAFTLVRVLANTRVRIVIRPTCHHPSDLSAIVRGYGDANRSCIDLTVVMGNATVGMATLRRDGFASIETEQGSSVGEVHTHSIIFTGKHFFVNMGLRGGGQGSVVVSINNHTTGEPIAPFTAANCKPITADSVRQAVSWQGAKDLSAVVRLLSQFN